MKVYDSFDEDEGKDEGEVVGFVGAGFEGAGGCG